MKKLLRLFHRSQIVMDRLKITLMKLGKPQQVFKFLNEKSKIFVIASENSMSFANNINKQLLRRLNNFLRLSMSAMLRVVSFKSSKARELT